MRKSTSGFTIVELLIVIVVIAILASIVIVSYNGFQEKARNADRFTQLNEWKNMFQLYKAKYGTFPYPSGTVSGTTYCLGTGFPNGKCREYQASGANTYLESGNTALMTELKKIGSSPTINPTPVDNWLVGPYVTLWSNSGVQLTQDFEGYDGDCPSGLTQYWKDDQGALICGITIN